MTEKAASPEQISPEVASIRVGRFGIVFTAAGEWRASKDAERFLKDAGFSLGSSQRGAPTACMFGNYAVAKWRNLNQDERRETHGTLTGDNRFGPLTFRLLSAAPDAAARAIETAAARARELAAQEAAQ